MQRLKKHSFFNWKKKEETKRWQKRIQKWLLVVAVGLFFQVVAVGLFFQEASCTNLRRFICSAKEARTTINLQQLRVCVFWNGCNPRRACLIGCGGGMGIQCLDSVCVGEVLPEENMAWEEQNIGRSEMHHQVQPGLRVWKKEETTILLKGRLWGDHWNVCGVRRAW